MVPVRMPKEVPMYFSSTRRGRHGQIAAGTRANANPINRIERIGGHPSVINKANEGDISANPMETKYTLLDIRSKRYPNNGDRKNDVKGSKLM